MQINVRSPLKDFKVICKPADSLFNLKLRIQTLENIVIKDQNLFFQSRLLDDASNLLDYGIQEGATIHLNQDLHDPFMAHPTRINVKTLDGTEISFLIDLLMTVEELKGKISKEQILVGRQNITFNGKVLEDDSQLMAHNIVQGSTLQLVKPPPSLPPYLQRAMNKTSKTVLERWNSTRIYVKELNGKPMKMIPYDLMLENTVGQLKQVIEKQQGIPVEDQTLLFAGKQMEDETKRTHYNARNVSQYLPPKIFGSRRMEDERQLMSYNVKKNSVIDLISIQRA
jgi:ubiquitin C